MIEIGSSTMNAAQAQTGFDDVATSTAESIGTGARVFAIALVGVLAGNLAATVVRADDTALAEVVVTAQRRSQNVQDVPASITVFTPQQLADFRIENPGRVGAGGAGLYVSHEQFGDPAV